MKQVVFAQSNAAFLNQVFGTAYRAWMKSRWEYDEGTWVWMIRFNKTIQGWRNLRINDNEIWEEYEGTEPPTYRKEPERKYRIVVEIKDGVGGREYHILGKYRYERERSFVGRHVLVKESEDLLNEG